MKMIAVRVWAATLLLYIVLWTIPDKRIALLCIFLYAGLISLIMRAFWRALPVIYMALVPLSVGKFFPIDLISANDLRLLDRPLGIAADISISGREGVVLLMTGFLVVQSIRRRSVIWPKNFLGWSLLFLPVCLAAATFLGSMRPEISIMHALFFIEPFIVYSFVSGMPQKPDYVLLVAASCAAVIGETGVVLLQHLTGGALGLAVEKFPGYIPIDVSTDAGYLLRPGGTFSHANALGHSLIFFVLLLAPVIVDAKSPVRRHVAIAVFFGLVSLLLTLSRSAWVSWAAGVGLVWYMVRVWRINIDIPHAMRTWIFGLLGILMVMVVSLGIPRILSTTRTMEPYGSGITRLLLIQSAGRIIGSHPLFGVGIGVDTYAFYLRARELGEPLVSYFPDPVQNGFLQLLMQVGALGLVAYLGVIAGIVDALLRMLKKAKQKNRLYVLGIAAGFLAVFMNAQFQPLLPDVTILVLLIAFFT